MRKKATPKRARPKQKRLSPDDRRREFVAKATEFFSEEGFGGKAHTTALRLSDIFRHLPVETALAGLDVRDWNVQLAGGQRTGQSGVGIAADDDPVWPFAQQHLFQAAQHLGRLAAMGPRAHFQVVIRGRNAHLIKERL